MLPSRRSTARCRTHKPTSSSSASRSSGPPRSRTSRRSGSPRSHTTAPRHRGCWWAPRTISEMINRRSQRCQPTHPMSAAPFRRSSQWPRLGVSGPRLFGVPTVFFHLCLALRRPRQWWFVSFFFSRVVRDCSSLSRACVGWLVQCDRVLWLTDLCSSCGSSTKERRSRSQLKRPKLLRRTCVL
jgi:hypothetical protein